jgi:hypothetical protein
MQPTKSAHRAHIDALERELAAVLDLSTTSEARRIELGEQLQGLRTKATEEA